MHSVGCAAPALATRPFGVAVRPTLQCGEHGPTRLSVLTELLVDATMGAGVEAPVDGFTYYSEVVARCHLHHGQLARIALGRHPGERHHAHPEAEEAQEGGRRRRSSSTKAKGSPPRSRSTTLPRSSTRCANTSARADRRHEGGIAFRADQRSPSLRRPLGHLCDRHGDQNAPTWRVGHSAALDSSPGGLHTQRARAR